MGCRRLAGHFGYRSQPKRDSPVTACPHQDTQTAPQDGQRQHCWAPLTLRGLTSQQWHQLGRTQLGANAAMGTTAAGVGTHLWLPGLCLIVVAPLPTILTPMKAITMTTRHQTLWTYTAKKFIIISTVIFIMVYKSWRGASVTITVWTPTWCNPDQLDRPCYFLFNLLNLATPLLSYVVHLALLFFVLLLLLPCYLYDAILIHTLGYPLYTISTSLSTVMYINHHVFIVEP